MQVRHITSNNKSLKELRPRLTDKKKRFDNNAGLLATLGTDLSDLTSTMTSNEATYNADRDRIMKAIKGCQAAVTELTKLEEPETQGGAGGGAGEFFVEIQEGAAAFSGYMQSVSTTLAEVRTLKKEARIVKTLLTMVQNG
jgi:hypothetical protein